MNKIVIAFILFSLVQNFSTFGQRIYSVVFNQLPHESQLFPRNDKNLALLPISGIIDIPDWSYMSVVLLREGKRVAYHRSNFVYPKNGNIAPFQFPDLTIKAEPAEYECQVYACKGKDSVLMVSRKHLVAGDFYIINGQSNATAYGVGNFPYTYKNKYLRTFGLFSNGLNLSNADTLWNSPDVLPPYVGAWGLQIQRAIIENHGIPTCFINGSVPGAHISNHLQRDGSNPSNIQSLYGSLLQRVIKAKALNHIKAFIWFHGEGDILSNSETYPEDFTKLYDYWKLDYPSIQKIIIMQNNVHLSNSTTGGAIREFQRKTGSVFPDVNTYAVNGASGFDGNHHSREGYIQIGQEVYEILAPLFYNVVDKTNVHSPNIEQVYFGNDKHDSIVLEFDKNQEMVIGTDTTVQGQATGIKIVKKVQDYIYFDNDITKIAPIISISANKNKVFITFKESIKYTKICYLPHSFYTPEVNFFIGPCLKNIAGRRAFSFYNVPIGSKVATLESPVLTKNVNYFNQIQLKWTSISNASKYILQRKTNNKSYSQVANVDGLTTEWIDTQLQANTIYTYRIKAQNIFLDSDYSTEIQAVTPAYLSNPNLISKLENLNNIKLSWELVPNSNNYTLEKSTNNKPYEILKILSNQTIEYLDKDITYGTVYNYKIKAVGNQTESLSSNAVITTPKELETPLLKASVINKNSLSIVWKKSIGATYYYLERSSGVSSFEKISQSDSSKISFTDINLIENTKYSYRIKASGNFTESKFDTLSIKTPDYLANPELTAEAITYEGVKIKWQAVPSATKYILENQLQGGLTFTKVFESDNLLEFTDSKLKENTSYLYRLRAFGTVSESKFGLVSVKTASILANLEDTNLYFNIFPNPSNEKVSVIFPEPILGNLSIFDLNGKEIFNLNITKQKSVDLNISSLQKGIYIITITSNQHYTSRKLIIE